MSVNDPSAVEETLRREHGGNRVLLAEDHRLNREVTAELLCNAGLAVDTAENGIEAVAMAARNSYDLILMDMKMPIMDGLRATHAIRLLPGYGDVPIIALTGKAVEADREACMAAGMQSYLLKPTPPDVLIAAALKWLPKTTSSNI
jgi:two-component system, sensor histidine kinase and response regulator